MALFLVSIFLAVMIGIGFWGLKKTSTLNDFFLGNRSIGPWISAMAYGTTYFSAVIFIGFAGKLGWQYGLNSLWIGLGNAFIGSLLAWLILARRTRRMTQNLDVMTMPEFFQERYQGRFLKMITATIIFIFLLPYSASVFKGLGHLFEISFHIPYDLALFVMIAITGVYLILGGYFAITLTDFIQGIIMFCCTLALITVLFNLGGGFAPTIAKLTANYAQHIPLAKHPNMLMLAALVFMTSFGVWGMPQMVQKFYAIKNEKVIPRAALVTTIFALLIGTAAYFNGAMAHLFYTPQTLPLAGGKIIFDKIVPQMMIAHLPEWLMAFILLLVLSASMSTLSSLILVSSSAIAIDMYKGHINPKISKENSLAMMRFLSGLFIVISYFIARYEFGIIVTLMSLSWGAVAGSFMAPYFYALYSKRTTLAGVKAGILTGLALSIGLFFILGPANSPIASSIAMIVPFVVVPVVSAFTKKPGDKVLKKAFKGI